MIVAAIVLAALPGLNAAELEESARQHLYNLELDTAGRLFAELSQSAPGSPAGPYYEATSLWMRELTRRGGMAGSTFRTGQYWALRKPEPLDPKVESDFRSLLDEAKRRAEAMLARDPDDREGLYFRGSVSGLESAYEASLERSYYGAYRAGKRAKEDHERLLELAPEDGDACLLPGIFEYTVATLPRTLRIAGFLFGLRGSKEKGLALVERAVTRGNRSRWMARLSLSVMSQREKRYSRSLAELRRLEQAFPRNPLLRLERGSVHLLRKDWRQARQAFEEVLARYGSGSEADAYVEPAFVRLKIGESYLFAKEFVSAARQFELGLGMPGVPDRVRAQLFLRRGNSSDGLGRRSAAEWDYRRALRLDVDAITNSLAERYLDQPFR